MKTPILTASGSMPPRTLLTRTMTRRRSSISQGLSLACLLSITVSAARAEIVVNGAIETSGVVTYTGQQVLLEGRRDLVFDSLNPSGTASFSLIDGGVTASPTATFDATTLSISASASATVAQPLQKSNPVGSLTTGIRMYMSSSTPFLFRATGNATLAGTVSAQVAVLSQSGGNASWLGDPEATISNPAVGSDSFAAAGIDTLIVLIGQSGIAVGSLYGSYDSQGSFSAHVDVDENVVRPIVDMPLHLAQSGQTDVAVNYPVRTTYTGLTEPQFTNVASIAYNPPAGSVFTAGITQVTSTVQYNKWGLAQSSTFDVKVIPGFAPADIVRVSWDGLPLVVAYEAPALPPGVVSSLTFYRQSGLAFSIGETTVTVAAISSSLGWMYRSFKVTIIDGSSWAASGPPLALQGDTDQDGQADWLEMEAGTNPNDPSERFAVQSVVPSGSDLVISWFGAGGITYQLESISLTGGPSTPIGAPVTAVGTRPLLTVTDSGALTAHASKFYRVKVATP